MLEFQLIGWVLIVLFFGAMVGGHKRTARHVGSVSPNRRFMTADIRRSADRGEASDDFPRP